MAQPRKQIHQAQHKRFKEKHRESIQERKIIIRQITHRLDRNYSLTELEVIATRAEKGKRVRHLTDDL